MSGPDVFATVRAQVTLLRGHGAQEAAAWSSPEPRPALVRYSPSGRGWTVPTSQLPDVEAFCQSRHWLLIISDKRTVTP